MQFYKSSLLTCGVGFCPKEFITVPSSFVLIVPSPSWNGEIRRILNNGLLVLEPYQTKQMLLWTLLSALQLNGRPFFCLETNVTFQVVFLVKIYKRYFEEFTLIFKGSFNIPLLNWNVLPNASNRCTNALYCCGTQFLKRPKIAVISLIFSVKVAFLPATDISRIKRLWKINKFICNNFGL